VRIINKFPDPPNKDVGEGLNTAFAAMSKLRLKPPVIQETENSVLVRIRHEPLASPEEAVMEYLETHDEIVNRTGREITGITSENSMKNVFYKLRDRGLIEPVPGRAGFAAAWRRKRRRGVAARVKLHDEPAGDFASLSRRGLSWALGAEAKGESYET
jgi:ATP-dependent DNA helicase RecG